MQLKIGTDSTGNKEYTLIAEDGSSRIYSEALVKFKIGNGEVTNAYIGPNGQITLVKDSKGAFVKSDKRIKMEMDLAEQLRSQQFDVVAVIRDDNNELLGYLIQDLAGNNTRVRKSAAILYASIGALRNAKVEYDGTSEYLVGKNIDLDNLAVIGGKQKKSNTTENRVANGVLNIDWQQVKDYKALIANREHTDKRSEMLDGMKYPKTSYLSRCNLYITVDNRDINLSVLNIQALVRDETDTMIVEAIDNDKSYRIMCHTVNYVEMNCYMVALSAYVGLMEINRKAKLNEVNMRDEDGRMWRLFFKDKEDSAVEDDAIMVDANMVRNLTGLYDISVSELCTDMTEEEQNRLVKGLRLDKSEMRITCEKDYYDLTEFVLGSGDVKRIDFTIKGSDGVERKYYYPGLRISKINIKNVILICAASISKLSEIRTVSIRAVRRESEYLVIFKSKIR